MGKEIDAQCKTCGETGKICSVCGVDDWRDGKIYGDNDVDIAEKSSVYNESV